MEAGHRSGDNIRELQKQKPPMKRKNALDRAATWKMIL
jgi:hypothetical protein